MKTLGYGAQDAHGRLTPLPFERRALRDDDVAIEIHYCGVCHSDLHQARNDWVAWGPTVYPCIPGHEIIGTVVEVGQNVSRYNVGDGVAVGTIVDSCRVCDQCRRGEAQMCRAFPTTTYNGTDRHDGSNTLGGYSKHIVVSEAFVLRMPDGLDTARAAPLL